MDEETIRNSMNATLRLWTLGVLDTEEAHSRMMEYSRSLRELHMCWDGVVFNGKTKHELFIESIREV